MRPDGSPRPLRSWPRDGRGAPHGRRGCDPRAPAGRPRRAGRSASASGARSAIRPDATPDGRRRSSPRVRGPVTRPARPAVWTPGAACAALRLPRSIRRGAGRPRGRRRNGSRAIGARCRRWPYRAVHPPRDPGVRPTSPPAPRRPRPTTCSRPEPSRCAPPVPRTPRRRRRAATLPRRAPTAPAWSQARRHDRSADPRRQRWGAERPSGAWYQRRLECSSGRRD